jgi:predicted acyl esterase
VLSLRRDTTAKLPKGKFSKLVIPLYYEGHMYRKGSRLRVTIQAPGGDQPVWAFDQTDPTKPVNVMLAHSKDMPSKLLLPVVSGVSAPTGLPPCPGLRGEPCRDYVPYTNPERSLR